jgi:hypothetical protein
VNAASIRLALDDAFTSAVPIVLARDSAGVEEAIVSPRIGFPYTLDTLSVWLGSSAGAILLFQVLIADDNDLTTLTNLTGEPLYRHRGDVAGGEPVIPWVSLAQGFTLIPRRRVTRAPTFLKVRYRVGVAGANVAFLFNLLELPESPYRA